MTTFKISALCFFACSISGVVTVLLGCHTGYLIWSGLAILLFSLALLLAFVLSHRFGWVTINASNRQLLIASMFIVAIYPVSLVVILLTALWNLYFTYGRDSAAFKSFSYSTLLRAPIDQIFDEQSIMLAGLTIATALGALLVAISLRVITRKWDRKVLLLMLLAILVTPFINQIIAHGFTQEGAGLVVWLGSLFTSSFWRGHS